MVLKQTFLRAFLHLVFLNHFGTGREWLPLFKRLLCILGKRKTVIAVSLVREEGKNASLVLHPLQR